MTRHNKSVGAPERVEHEPVSNVSGVKLPAKLIGILSELAIDPSCNRNNYEEFEQDLSPQDLELISRIMDHLMTLPLVHSSTRTHEKLLPHSASNSKGNTYELDISLGLDDCVFMTWGEVEKKPYGIWHTLVDSRLLLDERCFVTPSDVVEVASGEDVDFESLIQTKRHDVIERYFKKILSGRDWLELIARRNLQLLKNGGVLNIGQSGNLGEIKFTGEIGEEFIIGGAGPQDEESWWANLYKSGFVVGPVQRALQSPNSCDYNRSPEDLGIDTEEAEVFWSRLVATCLEDLRS